MRIAAQILLFIPIVIGYWYVHSYLATWILWVPELFTDRPSRLAGLFFAVVLCGVLAGLILAVPVRLLYQENSLLAAILVSGIAGGFDAFHMQLVGVMPSTQKALLLDLTAYMLALPLMILVLRRVRPNQSFKPNPLRGSAYLWR